MPPVINSDLCTRCGRCVDICIGDVFYGTKPGEIPLVNYPKECWHDGTCLIECPVQGAIELRIPLPMMISYK